MFTNQISEREKEKKHQQQRIIFCAYHPEKILHSFCVSSECLLPLCSECLTIHNQDHRRNQTFGVYQQLNTLIEDVKKRLRKQCSILQEFSEEYTEDYWEKERIIDDCRKSLTKLKEKVFKHLQRVFEESQRKLNIKVNQFHDSIHANYETMEAKLQHQYETNLRKLNILDCQDQSSQLITTRPSLKFIPEISSENDEDLEKSKFFHPTTKILKIVIEYYRSRENERVVRQNDEIKKQIERLKKVSLMIRTDKRFMENIDKMSENIKIEEFSDEQNIYFLPSRPKTIRK